ncbi:MAG: PPC domain-containing DNA-binding protein [Armatimonadota bacterium]
MQYSEGAVGRVFALRLEHGEPMPETLETFAAEKNVAFGMVLMVGGADGGSKFIVGPENGDALPPRPMMNVLSGVHEVAAVGTLFPDEEGHPRLHMHAAFGREDQTRAGCIRAGIVTWQVLEVILLEVTGLAAARRLDPKTGFHMLHCDLGGPQHDA